MKTAKRSRKRTIALLLAMVLAISALFPVTVLAASNSGSHSPSPNFSTITDQTARKDAIYWTAVNLKRLGVSDSDAIMVRLNELWWLESDGKYTGDFAYGKTIWDYTPESSNPSTTPGTNTGGPGANQPTTPNGSYTGGVGQGAVYYDGYNLYDGVLDVYDSSYRTMATKLAKIIYAYGHDVYSQTEQAAIGWIVLNNIDYAGKNATIDTVIKYFDYKSSYKTTDDWGRDLTDLAHDLIYRWQLGKKSSYTGETGRVLPSDYLWIYTADGEHYFRNSTDKNAKNWDWSLRTPYAN